MKTLLFTLLATLFFAFSSNAQQATATVKITDNKTAKEYKFGSLRDFELKADSTIDAALKEYGSNFADGSDDPRCQITIQITIDIICSGIPLSLTGQITGRCSKANKLAKQLRARLHEIAQDVCN